MANETNKARIIGDFLEINSYIVQDELSPSKLPKFIKKIRAHKQRKRLIALLDKFRDTGIVLEADNLIEFFSYIYNNFYPETKFGSIDKCRVDPEVGYYEAIVKFNNSIAIISIYNENYPKFNVCTKSTITSTGIDIETTKLRSDIKKKDDILKVINAVLVNDICDYIMSVIKPYYEDDKNGEEELVSEIGRKQIEVI